MNKIILNFILLGAILTTISCSNDNDPSPVLTPEQSASKTALEIVAGTVTLNERDTLQTGELVWEVTVQTTASSTVKVILHEEGSGVHKIIGDAGSFDYELDPGMGLILFSAARSTALNQIAGEIEHWKLDKNLDGVWVYEIDIIFTGGTDRVRINALTGLVI